jgi:hypothetical protein
MARIRLPRLALEHEFKGDRPMKQKNKRVLPNTERHQE